ncbi:conserved hypothetical protein [Candidatus Sulfopaludibacter sp. SbA6]|nr:conserved hypothetical protein [Candidatus Sulfopaludibacter sp. SbA6]
MAGPAAAVTDAISEYQRWKQQGEDLRMKAKHAMESRFRELLSAAAQIAEEYRADFGGSLKPPSPVTAFRYKASAKSKSKKTAKPKPAPPTAAPRVEPPAAKPNKKVAALQKRLATAKKKFEDAKSAGLPTRPLEDKIYEIEDELRLAQQA